MVLNSYDKSRKALAKLIKDYDKDTEKDSGRFRNTIYAFSILLNYFKFEKEIELEKDIEEIKYKLNIT